MGPQDSGSFPVSAISETVHPVHMNQASSTQNPKAANKAHTHDAAPATPRPRPLRCRIRPPPPLPLHGRRLAVPLVGHEAPDVAGHRFGAAVALGASVQLADPPRESFLRVPEYLLNASARPDPSRSRSKQYFAGDICSASGDGFLLISYLDTRATDPVLDKEARQVYGMDPDHVPDITRFVCNPVTAELSRLPDIDGTSKLLSGGTTNMDLLTRADRHGRPGPPDRYAVADFVEDSRHWVMERFLSETQEWEIVVSAPFRLPRAPRGMCLEQEALAFGGRLWWVDLTWGAISADPFDDRPEPRFVELPRGSVLPERTERSVVFAQGLPRYRRMGVSEGRLRYAEVSQREPFVLSSFVFDEEGSGGWTLEHRVALSRVWADGGEYPWLPLRGKETPEIAVLDPLNASVMYLAVGEHSVVVNIRIGEVIGSSLLQFDGDHFVPCVLPPWLGSSRIPSAGFLELREAVALIN
ncbi:uncharacterized protein LOC112269315 [Brachypodium distachyon]|uniref:uncharacterized protein LOC112269315 n=1 Tax=Brachypodium distachyon TaxID=15368 RepID=UPI0001C7037B|nr:uncharacterized protein LOC112269315 [Brachypodium distachyon]|eukprot:XP_024311573.1 uncharacterized protein LOC112269315 [Brachypodium distachyon]